MLAFLDVVDAIYRAALAPALWDEALRGMPALVDGVAAGIHVERAGRAVTQRWVGLEPKFTEDYRAHYWRADPWMLPARQLTEQSVGQGEAFLARRVLSKNAFYNDLCRPHGVGDLMVAMLSRTPTQIMLLAITGGTGKIFSAADAATTRLLVPHVARALDIGLQLRTFPLDVPDVGLTLEERLRLDFRLTGAEARVAVCVGQGRSPKEAAAMLGSTWNTVRSYLRRIFEKTGTSGQSELARLVVRAELGVPRGRTE